MTTICKKDQSSLIGLLWFTSRGFYLQLHLLIGLWHDEHFSSMAVRPPFIKVPGSTNMTRHSEEKLQRLGSGPILRHGDEKLDLTPGVMRIF
jgi:hypothetical protein